MTSDTGPGRRLAPDVRREQLLDAALRCFAVNGFDSVTFDVIAAEAKVSRSLLHNYFGDRHGLLEAVLLRCFAAIDQSVNAAFVRDGTAPDRLRWVIEAYVAFASTHAEEWRLLLHAERVDLPAVRATRVRRIDEVAGWLGGGVEGRAIASATIWAIERGSFQWLEEDGASPEALVELLHRLLWHGLPSVLPAPTA